MNHNIVFSFLILFVSVAVLMSGAVLNNLVILVYGNIGLVIAMEFLILERLENLLKKQNKMMRPSRRRV